MEYVRSKMSYYADITDEELKKFVKILIKENPSVIKKARLHLAALEPDIFDYANR